MKNEPKFFFQMGDFSRGRKGDSVVHRLAFKDARRSHRKNYPAYSELTRRRPVDAAHV